jgi:hypothetical protein
MIAMGYHRFSLESRLLMYMIPALSLTLGSRNHD